MTDPPVSDSSRELVQQAQHGDRAAFDALIRRSEARLADLVHARMGAELRRHEESRDVVQSALREAVAALPRFEWQGEGSFLRWLGTIVEHKIHHRARDLHRAKRAADRCDALGSRDPPATDPSPSAIAEGHQLEERYHEALAAMSAADRELLLLHVDLGCGPTEIAAALGIASSDAVRKRLARALARLAQAMESP
jgi:RNA polymerase sigma factor (sigma-70 family)